LNALNQGCYKSRKPGKVRENHPVTWRIFELLEKSLIMNQSKLLKGFRYIAYCKIILILFEWRIRNFDEGIKNKPVEVRDY